MLLSQEAIKSGHSWTSCKPLDQRKTAAKLGVFKILLKWRTSRVEPEQLLESEKQLQFTPEALAVLRQSANIPARRLIFT